MTSTSAKVHRAFLLPAIVGGVRLNRVVLMSCPARCLGSHAGLRFIGHNASFVTDDRSDTPAGFNVIFPGMLAHGIDMGLEIPMPSANVDAILRLRDTELKRFCLTHRCM